MRRAARRTTLLAVVTIALAGCGSNSQVANGSTVPSGNAYSQAVKFTANQAAPERTASGQEGLLEFYLRNKKSSPLPHDAVVRMLAFLRAQRRFHPTIRHDQPAPVFWANVMGYNTLLGQNKAGTGTVIAIDALNNDCETAEGIKVYSERLYVACASTSGQTNRPPGGVQEYSKTGSLLNTYRGGCPTNIPASECSFFITYAVDVALSGSTPIETGDNFEACYYIGSREGCYDYGDGWLYWASGPSGPPTYVNATAAVMGGVQIARTTYFDLDSSGNMWLNYYGSDYNKGQNGSGIVEVENPINPSGMTVVDIIPPGTLPNTLGADNPLGVYISNHGTVLNVTDTYARTVYQYSLPWSASEAPFNSFQTKADVEGCGEPLTGGFDKAGNSLAQGDLCGWLDVSNPTSKTSRGVTNMNFAPGLAGAAYVLSDK